jgi:hypothetical protein
MCCRNGSNPALPAHDRGGASPGTTNPARAPLTPGRPTLKSPRGTRWSTQSDALGSSVAHMRIANVVRRGTLLPALPGPITVIPMTVALL